MYSAKYLSYLKKNAPCLYSIFIPNSVNLYIFIIAIVLFIIGLISRKTPKVIIYQLHWFTV